MSKRWPFADHEWWAYAATQTVPSPLGVDSALPVDAHGRVDLDAAKAHEALLIRDHLNVEDTLDKTQARTLLFWARALKKWQFMPPERVKRLNQEALDGFEARNARANRGTCLASRPYLAVHMRDYLRKALPPLPSEDRDRIQGRFGPGAVAERLSTPKKHRVLGAWHLLGCHPELESLIRTNPALDPELKRALAALDCDVARLCAVDKSYDKRRLITVEPTYHTFEQQRVRSVLLESLHRGALRGTAMDQDYVDGAERQRRLALRASRTKKLATLDLSDASDNIALSDVYEVFPAWVCAELEMARTTYYSRDGGPAQPLFMYGGMGNATTFIVETLFFASLVYAIARLEGLPAFVSVFGDDIICHSWTADAIIERWDLPCLKVNALKSFWGQDQIRESCGVYAYKGMDISVPHITGYSAKSVEGLYGVCDLHRRMANDPLMWGLAHAIACEDSLENYSFLIDGYPSICDWTAPTRDDSVVTKRDPNTQTRLVKVRAYEPRKKHVTTYTPDTLSLGVEVAAAMGLIHTTGGRIPGVAYALPGFRRKPRWRRIVPVVD